MERLLVALLIWLLKLVVQLVMFAATGKWYKFGRGGQLLRPDGTPLVPAVLSKLAKPTQKSAQRPQIREKTRPAQAADEAAPEGPWPFEFAPEMFEAEPDSEAAALALEQQQVARRAKMRARAKVRAPAVSKAPRRIADAIRDRRTVRDALVLGAALGPRRARP